MIMTHACAHVWNRSSPVKDNQVVSAQTRLSLPYSNGNFVLLGICVHTTHRLQYPKQALFNYKNNQITYKNKMIQFCGKQI